MNVTKPVRRSYKVEKNTNQNIVQINDKDKEEILHRDTGYPLSTLTAALLLHY